MPEPLSVRVMSSAVLREDIGGEKGFPKDVLGMEVSDSFVYVDGPPRSI